MCYFGRLGLSNLYQGHGHQFLENRAFIPLEHEKRYWLYEELRQTLVARDAS